MSIKISLSSDGLEEVFTPPTLKEMCLYKCLTNKEILTTEVEVDEATNGSEKLTWEKYRLKEAIQRDLVEALLDAGDEYLFQLTPKYEPVLAAIRMSQPEHLVKVHVSNTRRLTDNQLEWLISGGNVKSLDIHGCIKLRGGSLDAINKFGNQLEYLRIGGSYRILPDPFDFEDYSAMLRTPNLKTFIVSEIQCNATNATNYWRFLLQDFINNLEDLQISGSRTFRTLEFLEPAKSKLSFLTLRNCGVTDIANAWASLFKLDKLRSLDLVGSSIGEAFVGENVVQRLLTAMPNLTRLAVDPGLVKHIRVETPIQGQGSVAKRLEFLGVMDNDAEEIGKAQLLANDVAYFGTVVGELRILEYYSNRIKSSYFDSSLERLLISLSKNKVTEVPRCKTVAVINLLMKTLKNHGVGVVSPELFLQVLKELLTADVAAKLGVVLLDQCIEAIYFLIIPIITTWVWREPDVESVIISDAVDIMMNLDGKLGFHHYATVVPTLMCLAKYVMTNKDLADIGIEAFKGLLEKMAQLLEKVLDRFPGEANALWGIPSVLVVIKEFQLVIVSQVIFNSMIASLRKLCVNFGSRKATFHSAGGVVIVMQLLTEIIDGSVCLVDRDSFALLEILKRILKDTKLELDLSQSGMIASSLEQLLISVHSQWEVLKSSNSERENIRYFQLERISGLLNFLESDPRNGYKTSAGVKEITMKF